MSIIAKDKKSDVSPKASEGGTEFALGKENYKLLAIGFAIIIFGFILLMGSSNSDPKVFNSDIYSFRRIVLAPFVILAGFIFEIFAIMKKQKSV